jgi:hypothetical protein
MPQHVRQQLRQAIAAALSGLPSTGANVFPGREWPADERAYPGLLIYARGGRSTFDSMAADDADVILEREEQVVIEGIVRAKGGEGAVSLDDQLDAIAAEVEPIVMTDPGIAALLDRRELVETVIDVQIGGDARLGSVRLTYRVMYSTAAGDPSVKL